MPEQNPFFSLTGDKRAAEVVKQRHLVSQKALRRYHSDYDKWFRMYKGERVTKNYDGFSNISVPKVFEKVERGSALLVQAIKKVRVIGQGNISNPQSPDKQAAETNEKLIEYEDRVLEIRRTIKQYIKSARIHGQSYIKVVWNPSKSTPERPYKGIDLSLPDPKSIFYNPDWTPDQPFRWVVHEYEVPLSEVKKNKTYSKQAITEIERTAQLGNTVTGNETTGVIKGQETSDTTTLMVNIKEYYGPYADSDDKDEEQYVIVLGNNNQILFKKKSQYAEILDEPIPIIPLQTYVVPHENHAMGDPEVLESLYAELNDTRNQRLDTVTLNIDPMKIILRAAQIDEQDLIAKRGWVIQSNIPNAVQVVPPDMQGVVASVNEEKIIQGDIDRTVGIPSLGAETPVSGDITTDTATGVNATLQAQDVVSNSILEEVKASLTQVYRAILAYNQTFIDQEFIITLLEEQGPTELSVSPERIQGNMDLDVEIELVGNRLARRAEALAAIRIIGQFPGANVGKLIEDYLKTQDKYNFEEYWQPPQQEQPEPPKVSVSLRGELGQMQAASVYSTIPGVNQRFGDPAFTEEGRKMMRGQLPEFEEDLKLQSEVELNRAKAINELQNAQTTRDGQRETAKTAQK